MNCSPFGDWPRLSRSALGRPCVEIKERFRIDPNLFCSQRDLRVSAEPSHAASAKGTSVHKHMARVLTGEAADPRHVVQGHKSSFLFGLGRFGSGRSTPTNLVMLPVKFVLSTGNIL